MVYLFGILLTVVNILSDLNPALVLRLFSSKPHQNTHAMSHTHIYTVYYSNKSSIRANLLVSQQGETR